MTAQQTHGTLPNSAVWCWPSRVRSRCLERDCPKLSSFLQNTGTPAQSIKDWRGENVGYPFPARKQSMAENIDSTNRKASLDQGIRQQTWRPGLEVVIDVLSSVIKAPPANHPREQPRRASPLL
jgi:hypothetical protein